MPLSDPYLSLDARWTRLFRALKAVRDAETDPVLYAHLRAAEHKLRIAYTLNDYPKETKP